MGRPHQSLHLGLPRLDLHPHISPLSPGKNHVSLCFYLWLSRDTIGWPILSARPAYSISLMVDEIWTIGWLIGHLSITIGTISPSFWTIGQVIDYPLLAFF